MPSFPSPLPVELDLHKLGVLRRGHDLLDCGFKLRGENSALLDLLPACQVRILHHLFHGHPMLLEESVELLPLRRGESQEGEGALPSSFRVPDGRRRGRDRHRWRAGLRKDAWTNGNAEPEGENEAFVFHNLEESGGAYRAIAMAVS